MALLLLGAVPFSLAAGQQLSARYDKISDSTISAIANHIVGFNVNDLAVPIGSIVIEFCSNSPLIGDSCTAPSGFDASGANLNSQVGETGFTIGPGSNANKIILTRPAALPTGAVSQYLFSNIVNPDAAGSYYGRLQTFTSTDGTGSDIEDGGFVFAILRGLSVSAEVPPYLTFCAGVTITNIDCSTATSFLIDMGEFSKTHSNQATSEFAVATNAEFGYSITISGTTLTSGINAITALGSPTASIPGTKQFGMNLRANTVPAIGSDKAGYGLGTPSFNYNQSNLFKFQNGDVIATASAPDYEKYTTSYLVNVDNGQAAGFYATTLTFIALGNF